MKKFFAKLNSVLDGKAFDVFSRCLFLFGFFFSAAGFFLSFLVPDLDRTYMLAGAAFYLSMYLLRVVSCLTEKCNSRP